ncbi:flavodoxin family protein, partial [bacterium]|nr:flavodoxin family protein [bacterium]
MRLIIINGSPRGEKSNTSILMGHFTRGFLETEGNSIETIFLIKERPGFDKALTAFLEAERILLAFPLYVDAMPGSVKEYIEALAPLRGRRPDLTLMYLVQNGFPETCHNRPVARYLEKLTKRLGCLYGGSILKGGCEGLDVQPSFLVDKVFRLFYEVGKSFGRTGMLDEALLTKLARPEHMTPEQVAQVIPMVNGFLWD